MKFILIAAVALVTSSVAGADDESSSNYEARSLYRAALDDLSRGRTTAFRKKQEALSGYVLAPYLEYRYALRHISQHNLADIERFAEQHPTLPAAEHLRRAYLKNLARRRAPQRFLAAYPEGHAGMNAELMCFHARALYATGQAEAAFAAAERLWLVGRSQSKECDPIFERWRKTDAFTQQVVWRRITLAVEANQTRLARYLTRYLSGTLKERADALITVHANPRLIARTDRYAGESSEARYIIQHGLSRLARREPEQAVSLWNDYQNRLPFTEPEAELIERQVFAAHARQGVFPPGDFTTADDELILALADAAVREQEWPQAERWIDELSESERHKPQWQYWLARSLVANHGDSERAALTYASLAERRTYYGFLAADHVGKLPALVDESQPVDETVLESLSAVPNVARAIELLAVGDRLNARREWNRAIEDASTQQERRLLGYAALHLGELRLAISTANRADLLNEVTLRFPTAYMQQFRTASTETDLPIPLLLAVTRQESAFDRTARSSANARGLMQLLPSTAATVARRLNESAPSTTLLYQADTNVRLGAHYLAWLGARFNEQTPLITAAYNAGEHRVDRWIRDQDGLPMDIWIERIPFRETRNYVKNVLAFRQVYSKLLGVETKGTLAEHERTVVEP